MLHLNTLLKSTVLPFLVRKRKVIFITIGILIVSVAGLLCLVNNFNRSTKQSSKLSIDSLIGWKETAYKNNPSRGFQQLEMAKAIAKDKGDHESLGDIYSKEASFEKSLHQHKKAIVSCSYAIKEYATCKNTQGLASSYYKLGDNYKKLGEFNLGFKATIKGLNLYIKINDQQGQRRCYNNIGSFYKYLEDYPRAIEFYQKALKISQELSYGSGIASAYNNLGTIYSALNEYDLALEFYAKSIATNYSCKSSLSKAIYYGNIASVYTKQKRYNEAYVNFIKAERLLFADYEPKNLASHYIDFGEYYENTKQLDSAITNYKRGLALANEFNFKERMAAAYQMLSSAYVKKGDYKSAIEAQKAYLTLREKLVDSRKSLEIARLENEFEVSKSQLENDNAKLKQYLLLSFLAITIIILTITVVQIRKKYRMEVTEQRKIRQHLENEKEKVENNLCEKNRELALYSLQKIQQRESNEALVDRLRSKTSTYSADTKKEINVIINELLRENNHQHIWEEFEHRFISVNPEFYSKLSADFPELTQNERRICAFLKLNMTTKEISSITGQSPHSINVARTRLRKKIGITNSSSSLNDFISSI